MYLIRSEELSVHVMNHGPLWIEAVWPELAVCVMERASGKRRTVLMVSTVLQGHFAYIEKRNTMNETQCWFVKGLVFETFTESLKDVMFTAAHRTISLHSHNYMRQSVSCPCLDLSASLSPLPSSISLSLPSTAQIPVKRTHKARHQRRWLKSTCWPSRCLFAFVWDHCCRDFDVSEDSDDSSPTPMKICFKHTWGDVRH